MTQHAFELWLEFEVGAPWGGDPENDFFNMQVTLGDGRRYALNVWTFKFLEHARQQAREEGEHLAGEYLPAPDLFVSRLDRRHLEEVIADLISTGGLREEWVCRDDEIDGEA